MQYIYVLDYSTPSRVTIKVAGDNIEERIDDILKINNLKASECSWLISDKPLDDNKVIGTLVL